MTLKELKAGESAAILTIGGEGALRRRLLDMGLTPHTMVTVRKIAPFGDPMELSLRGYELTLRREEADNITIEVLAPGHGRQARNRYRGGKNHADRTGR